MIKFQCLRYDSQLGLYIYRGKSYKKIKNIVRVMREDGLSEETAIEAIQLAKKTKDDYA